MKFTIRSTAAASTSTPCLVLGVFEQGKLPELTAEVDKASGGALRKLLDSGDISGKPGEILLARDIPDVKAKRILLAGCGKQTKLDAKVFVKVIKSVIKALDQYHQSDACLALADLTVKDIDSYRKALLVAREAEMSQYHYRSTLSKPKPAASLKSLSLLIADKAQRTQSKKGLATGSAVAQGMNLARELGNLPANICTPTHLSEQAQSLGKKYRNLKIKILSEAQMKRMKMGSLLSVSAGSVEPAALIVMEYQGTSANTRPDVIVGKGITFDTGGISLKAGSGMDEMKFDMCGAASVFGTMLTLCELGARTNVVGVVAAAENMPSGVATKPGDVVTSMAGKTIEVLNTDAEGRLVLCDALTYVERFKPRSVIDIATLTGACIVALGSHVSGMLSNDDELADTLYQCGLDAQDPVWRLPLWEEYQKQLDSNFADIANIGGPKAGTITAGCFLSRFTESYRWAHLDIAGTAWLQGDHKGATGRPVPLLVEYLLSQ